MKFLKEFDFSDKRTLVRVDFNEPIINNRLTSDFKIKATLPTIKYLTGKGAKVILLTHLGRPDGKIVEELRTGIIGQRVSRLLNRPVRKLNDCVGREVEEIIAEMKAGETVILENVQFYPGEKAKDPAYINSLAKLADFFVFDAFGQAHRDYASISGLPRALPGCAGSLCQKEIEALTRVLENPEHPLVIIIGGAKISTKMKVIKRFLATADSVLLGGALANTALKAKGVDTGKSVVEDKMLGEAGEILGNPKLHLPIDWIISDEMILDIGQQTIKEFGGIISSARTIVFNGPMGLFEKEQFSSGSGKIARAVAESDGCSLAGGGDTIALLEGLNLIKEIDHVSTGGGAMLEFLAGKKLPGLEALNSL